MARLLLSRRWKLVNDTIFFALVIYSVGCIVPTTLDAQTQPMNYSPVIVSATPPFGPFAHKATDSWSWALTASDPNPGDVLSGRIFIVDKSSNQYLKLADVPMTSQQSTDPTLKLYRSGETSVEPWCATRVPDTYEIVAFVSDRGFINDTSTMSNGGLEDSNHWELTCD
jgi:hypothetical protein